MLTYTKVRPPSIARIERRPYFPLPGRNVEGKAGHKGSYGSLANAALPSVEQVDSILSPLRDLPPSSLYLSGTHTYFFYGVDSVRKLASIKGFRSLSGRYRICTSPGGERSGPKQLFNLALTR